MKRLTALALCLTTVFTLGTSVSAATTLSSTTPGSNSTEQQIIEYFEGEENKKRRKNKVSKTQVMGYEFYSDLRVLYKKDLMKMFNMGRTKFLEFIKTETIPVKVIAGRSQTASYRAPNPFA